MAYQVLARKWRPRKFAELVGQQHVVRVLSHALQSQRVHHAYLFTGTRGVGKTTIARIFAKSLNCEVGVTAEPCGECHTCKEIDAGRFVDLLEVDAASRTKVDDTRELLDNVQYAPARGRYKVYLIDEVHMLSTSSFNALLKTLEEPPPHVKFLFATTDPQKLPATILSRCLQFNLKRMTVEQVANHLSFIVNQEAIDYEPAALQLLAKAADGSMRDALSLLDQAIAFGGGRLPKAEVAAMLGTLEHGAVFDLLHALAAQDGAALLERVGLMAEHNPDYSLVLGDLLSALQKIALAQVVPATLDPSQEGYAELLPLCNRLSAEEVQLYYQIGLHGRRDLPLAPEPRGGFEMALLRMLAFRPALSAAASPTPVASAPAAFASSAGTAAAVTTATPSGQGDRLAAARAAALGGATPAPTAPATASAAPPTGEDWASLVSGLSGPVKMLADNCVLTRREDQVFYLSLPPRHASFRNMEERLRQALEKRLGPGVRLNLSVEELGQDAITATPAAIQQQAQQVRQQAAVEAIEGDPIVTALRETFDARLDKTSIKPQDPGA